MHKTKAQALAHTYTQSAVYMISRCVATHLLLSHSGHFEAYAHAQILCALLHSPHFNNPRRAHGREVKTNFHQGQPDVYGFNGNDLSASESVGAI